MATNGWNQISNLDVNASTGGFVARSGFGTHLEVDGGSFPACKAAALAGLVAFDAYVNTGPFTASEKNWYFGHPAEHRDRIRKGFTLLNAP